MTGESFPSQPYSHNEYEEEDKDLEQALERIWDIADENHLDPFPTHFEVVPARIMNQIGAYGIPNRYSHWTYGREYRQMHTQYEYGMSKIYELVINSNPAQAFLLENNPPIDNKFVMAHVLGHTDFFKNNFRFTSTRRDMPEAAARSADRIAEYEKLYGREEVEKFLDATLAIEQHVDPFAPHRPLRDEELRMWREAATRPQQVRRRAGEFDDILGVPEEPQVKRELGRVALSIPPKPDSDILGFVRNHAPYLEDWQRDIVDVVRGESIYFYPQRRTKIMNEGWAAYWHKRIMRKMGDRGHISDADTEAWDVVHSSVVQPNPKSLNPYYLGMMVYEYLEEYYNGTLTEKETRWLQSQDMETYPKFEGELKDSPAALKLREVMMHNDDQSFIRNYFDKNIAERMNMFIYDEYPDYTGKPIRVVREKGWEDIRDMLVSKLDNAGTPYIVVANGDHGGAGELYLRHEFDGRTLDTGYINKTLPYIYQLWQRPVHLETVSGTDKMRYTYDGKRLRADKV